MKALKSDSNKYFIPTDDELLQKFLYNKINNKPIPNYLNILEQDLFGIDKTPLDIWNEFEASYSYNGKDLYFFTTLKKKSATSTRSIRTIGNGNWEGEDTGKKIFAKDTNKLLDKKKRFRFENSNTPQDGGWILLEYNLHESLIDNSLANNYVLCRFRKNLKSESQNTQSKASIVDQSSSHLRKIPRTINYSAQENKRKTLMIPKQQRELSNKKEPLPKQEESVVSGNNVLIKKYIIYEETTIQSNIQSNDGGNKRKYEDNIEFVFKAEKRKCIRSTWPERNEYNNLFFGEKIEQNSKNRVDSRNSKNEMVGRTNQREYNFNTEDENDIIMSKEEDEKDIIMSKEEDEMPWPEFFAKHLLEINGGAEFIKEKDVQMIENCFLKDF